MQQEKFLHFNLIYIFGAFHSALMTISAVNINAIKLLPSATFQVLELAFHVHKLRPMLQGFCIPQTLLSHVIGVVRDQLPCPQAARSAALY